MSKENKVMEKEVKKETVENKTNNVAEPKDKVAQAIEVLQIQFREHSAKAEEHKVMATKAQGALEVLLQLHPQETEVDG
jgi:hypothetical protein